MAKLNDGLRVNSKYAEIHEANMEKRIIAEIREMDMDVFLALIEFMYPVKASLSTDDVSNIIIEVDKEKGFDTLDQIF